VGARFKTIAGLVLALVFQGAALSAELSVELPHEIEARDGWFYLGEYAEMEGDGELVDGASVAVIHHNGAFTRDDVIDALSATAAAGKSVAIRMPDTVRVSPEPDISAELRAMTAWKWRIDVSAGQNGWNEIMRGYSGYSLPPKVAPGARSLAVKLIEDDGRRNNKQVKVTWYQPVVYSAEPLEKKSPIDASALRMRIDSADMNLTSLWAAEQAAGAVARRNVPAGTALTEGDISRVDFVRAGSTVTMTARVNGLGVEVRGIAMQRGGVGDIIKVKNLSSGKVLAGRVVDAGRVEIESP
jgi:flagella basal body P-ring formation protein FlgA